VRTQRYDYILGYLAEETGSYDRWIKITDDEFRFLGGLQFFKGCTVLPCDQWYTTRPGKNGFEERAEVFFKWKIIPPKEGWNSLTKAPYGTTYGSTTANTIAVSINSTLNVPTTERENTMQEHHIPRERLIEVVTENKDEYEDKYSHLKALYTDEIESKTRKHLDGEIPQSQIMVTDKKGNKFELPVDMSDIYDIMLRELDLDSREVVILNDQDYGSMVENTSSNLRNIEQYIKMLEEE
jgi:hypothetical protein